MSLFEIVAVIGVAQTAVMAAVFVLQWMHRRDRQVLQLEWDAKLRHELLGLKRDMYESGGRVSQIDHALVNLKTALVLKDVIEGDGPRHAGRLADGD